MQTFKENLPKGTTTTKKPKNTTTWECVGRLFVVLATSYAPTFPPNVLNKYFIVCPFIFVHVCTIFFFYFIFFLCSLFIIRMCLYFFSFQISSAFTVATYIRPFCQHFIADATGCYRYYCLHKLFPKDFYFIAQFELISIYFICVYKHALHDQFFFYIYSRCTRTICIAISHRRTLLLFFFVFYSSPFWTNERNHQNPDIVLVHYLNVPYPDDNKMAVVTPSLALWGDKKEWTKEELVCQLKPMCKYITFSFILI